MGTNVQVCWHKFARYWDVEQRLVPVEGERHALGAEEAVASCDENTIGVVGVLGSTFTGEYEPIAEISAALDDLQARTGLDVPIHVDGASGGFVAPFLQPDLVWDFRLPRVKSINASGHKYGLAPLGVGWVLWRDAGDLPEELVFHVNYLGGDMPVFAINFSRPGSQVIAQYYNFVRLGREGYRRIQQNAQDVALHLADEIEAMGPFRILTRGTDLPVLSWTMADGANFSVFELSEALRAYGWQVPAYTMPADLTDLAICRIVVRHGLRRDLADLLLDDMREVVDRFVGDPEPHALDVGPERLQPRVARPPVSIRRLDWWIGLLFAIGSVGFALGAFPYVAARADPTAVAITFFVGSIFFTCAAGLQLAQAVMGGGWLDRLATAVQFAGTLFSIGPPSPA